MSEWRWATLAEVTDFGIGGTPSRNIPAFWAEKPAGYPWLSIADLKSKFVSDTSEHISDLGAASSNVKNIPAGTTVMSFKLTVGRTAITMQPMYCNEAIAFIHAKAELADSRWLYHELPRASKHVVTDTAVKGATLNKKKLAEIPLLLPPTIEQRKVAEILDTLDTQIHQTEALIAKLERIKQGLLTDLLTRGIDQNGQLRRSPGQAPSLYKDSPLGRIPKKWVSQSLSDITESLVDGPFGSNLKTEHYVLEPGVRVARLQNISSGEYSDADRAYIAKSHASNLSRNTVLPGDVLIAALGDETNPAGRACLYPAELPPAINKADCFRLRSQDSVALNEFLMLFMNSIRAAAQVKRYQQGVTLQRINLNNLRSIKISVPPKQEQREIWRIAVQIFARLNSSKSERNKLKTQKLGLMDDLLTGRVRVTPLLKDKDRTTA